MVLFVFVLNLNDFFEYLFMEIFDLKCINCDCLCFLKF